MRWREGYIAIDWGTTNRRAYAIGAHGRLTDSLEDDRGIMQVPAGGFEPALAEIRERLGGGPVLMAGMIGSNRGWMEAPYVPCPAAAPELAAAIRWVEPEVGIVPGISLDDERGVDVMRGEEVQVIGALALRGIAPGALICHPGTHAKWIVTAGGRIDHFRTMMTGELFGLLRKHSILSAQLTGPVTVEDSFREGVTAGLAGSNLLSDLFQIRARHVLGRSGPNGAAYASGLLIGGDVRSGLELHRAGPVGLVGRSDLRALYAAALALAGHEVVEVDGGDAFLAGIATLTELL